MFQINWKTLYRKHLLVWRCKISANRANHVNLRAYMTQKTVHHWHGTTTDDHPHNLSPMRHNPSHKYMHTTNKGAHKHTHTHKHYTYWLTKWHVHTHHTYYKFINIILCTWWRLNIDIMMLTIKFIL